MKNNDTNAGNKNVTNGRSDKNPRTHMKNENGVHASATKSVTNRAKDTGAKPSSKDGMK